MCSTAVHTVTGTIEPDQLGWTLPHEHVIVGWDGALLDSTLSFDRAAIQQLAVEKLMRARAHGVKTIIDMTTIEMGRDPDLLRRLSDETGIQIICCTGLFAADYGLPYYFRELSIEHLTELYVTEIENGIGSTGVHAGVIKVATSGMDVSADEVKTIRAAARAQRATGVPVLTHTGFGVGGDIQVRLLVDEGVPADKIVIGHSDVSANLKYHLQLLGQGVYIGFDRIGLPAFNQDGLRAECIASLVRLGYVDRLTMSLDAHVLWLGRPHPLVIPDREFTYLHTDFFPMLRRAGVDDRAIDQIMVDNPRRLFSNLAPNDAVSRTIMVRQ